MVAGRVAPVRSRFAIVLLMLAGTGLAACVDDSNSTLQYTPDGTRLVTITMADLAYHPDTFAAKAGELVTFEFLNTDDVVHEAVIGSEAEQLAHETEMDGMGGMDMGDMGDTGGTELPSVTVAPGESVELKYGFDSPGPVVIGCHEPGHWDQGMRLDVDVV